MSEDLTQIRICPNCGQRLQFAPGSRGETRYCPNCESPVCPDVASGNTRGDCHGMLMVLLGTVAGLAAGVLVPYGMYLVGVRGEGIFILPFFCSDGCRAACCRGRSFTASLPEL